MEILEPQRVMKGGVCWLDITPSRCSKGLALHVKADPRIEDFIKSLGSGKKDTIDVYGRSWFSLTGEDLEIHQIEHNVQAGTYTLDAVTESFRCTRDGRVNLSLLRIVGIGDPQGIRFGLTGPFSKPYVKESLQSVIAETRNLILDYIAPIHLNLRITSTEV